MYSPWYILTGEKWKNKFLQLGAYCDGYQNGNITLYMHIMSWHIPEFIKKYGNIKQFSCQGDKPDQIYYYEASVYI